MHSRLNIVKWMIIALIVLIFSRLIYIQFYDSNIGKTSKQVHKRLISHEIINAKNGRILARDGSVLATTVERKEIFFDMASHGFDREDNFTEQVDSLSKLLSQYFGQHSHTWYADTMKRIHNRAIRRDSINFKVEDRRSLFGKLFGSKKNIDCLLVGNTNGLRRKHSGKLVL